MYHMEYGEILRLPDGATLVARVSSDRAYRLGLYRRGVPLVEFRGEGAVHQRRVADRVCAYEFRSIEQLRYDFERDAENALDRN